MFLFVLGLQMHFAYYFSLCAPFRPAELFRIAYSARITISEAPAELLAECVQCSAKGVATKSAKGGGGRGVRNRRNNNRALAPPDVLNWHSAEQSCHLAFSGVATQNMTQPCLSVTHLNRFKTFHL